MFKVKINTMEIVIKPGSKEYAFLNKDNDLMVEVLHGEEILTGYIKSLSTNGTYIVEIMEKNNVWSYLSQ